MRFVCSFASIARSNRLVPKITCNSAQAGGRGYFQKARPYHCGSCYCHHNSGDPAHDA